MSRRYTVRYTVPVEVVVRVVADDEEAAELAAHRLAGERLSQVAVELDEVSLHGDVDGYEPETVVEG